MEKLLSKGTDDNQMNQANQVPDTRGLLRGLRALGDVKAPSTLLTGVLEQCGLMDRYWRLHTPIGDVFVAYNHAGISAVMRAADGAGFEAEFQARFRRPVRPAVEPPEELLRSVQAHLSSDKRWSVGFDLRGLSEFERAVLLKALEIPRGEVRPYSWIAKEIGRPGATRAVGNTLAHNPIPLLIPCHRVVRSDGLIGEYAFGQERKREMLRAEGAAPEVLESLARSGVRYYADTDDGTYCLPSCGQLHLRNDLRLLPFRRERDAVAAGFEPCGTCRPALAS